VIVAGAQKIRMLIRIWRVETSHKISEVNKNSLGIGLVAIYVMFWQVTSLDFSYVLRNLQKVECKGDGLINLVIEISRQPHIQTIAWVSLATFTQVYNKNQEKKQKRKI
jgi:hypothetical protein